MHLGHACINLYLAHEEVNTLLLKCFQLAPSVFGLVWLAANLDVAHIFFPK